MPLFGRGQSRPPPRPAPARARPVEEDDDVQLEDYEPDMASPKEIAKFLVSLKPLVQRAIEVRASWIRELGVLFEEARQGNEAHVTSRAGRLGRDHVTLFRDVRSAVERFRPPEGCQEIHRSVVAWTDSLVKACEALIEVGNTSQLAGMQIAQRNVTEARHAARRFNSEYTRLLTELRVAVRSARRGV